MAMLREFIAAGVRNPVYANLLMTAILGSGLLAAQFLVTETHPEFSLDTVTVTARYPGASPAEVETGVNIKIEEAVEGLAGVKKVTSRADAGGGLVVVDLQAGADARLSDARYQGPRRSHHVFSARGRAAGRRRGDRAGAGHQCGRVWRRAGAHYSRAGGRSARSHAGASGHFESRTERSAGLRDLDPGFTRSAAQTRSHARGHY